jgi:hypothetical protein
MWGRLCGYADSVVAIDTGSADIFIGGSLVATAKKFAVVVGF